MARPAKYPDTDLLDRSYELLWRDGCDAVSIRDLETALDLKAPSIYRRFHSRDELVARSVDRYVERVVVGRVRRHLGAADDPVAGLRTFFLSAVEPVPGEAVPRGCLLTVAAGQTAGEGPRARAAVDTGIAVVEDALRAQVRRAAAAGRTAVGVDTDAMAVTLLLALQGLLVLARTGRTDLGAAVEQLLAACFPSTPSRSPSEPAGPSTTHPPERTTHHE